MNKLFTFLLISLFVSFGLVSKSAADTNQSALVNPIATPTPLAEIESVKLDKSEVVYICPWHDGCGKIENLMVLVKTSVRNPKKIPLSHKYTISGGKIIGQGEEVLWDLKGVRPGIYTITVAIDDGRGFSDRTSSETVEVSECHCYTPCKCPNLDVSGSSSVKAGKNIMFTANVTGGTVYDITYNWTISQGEIIDGQGTSLITVKTTPEMIGIIKATVEIGGYELCESCPRIDSETATIIK